jgi:hypothetical protein
MKVNVYQIAQVELKRSYQEIDTFAKLFHVTLFVKDV